MLIQSMIWIQSYCNWKLYGKDTNVMEGRYDGYVEILLGFSGM